MDADAESANQVAKNIARLLAIAEPLSVVERRHVCELLGERSPYIRQAHNWTEVFGPLFVVGALFLLGSVFVVLDNGPLWLAIGFVVVATVVAGVPSIKVWHCAVQALDIGVGLVRENRTAAGHPNDRRSDAPGCGT